MARGERAGVLAVTILGLLASTAAAETFIAPDGGSDQGFLTRPASFDWNSYGVTGHASGIHWSHWGARHARGTGRTRLCVTMNGECLKRRRVTIVASGRTAFQGPEDTDYLYCSVTISGRLDPSKPRRILSIKLADPGGDICS